MGGSRPPGWATVTWARPLWWEMDASILISHSDKEHAAGTFTHLRSSSIDGLV